MTTDLALPDVDDTGDVRRWYLPVTPEGQPHRRGEFDYELVYARFLGVGTSFTDVHSSMPHPDGFVPRKVRCNACRWFETRIFRELVLPDGVDDLAALAAAGLTDADVRPGAYVLHSVGASVVAGEVHFCSVQTTTSPYSVVELLTTRRTNTDRGPEAFIAKPAAAALAEAAGNDHQLAQAYVDRAVS